MLGGELETFTPHTVTDPEELRRELVSVRTRGYAQALEGFEDGLNAVAALPQADGRVVAALGVRGPRSECTRWTSRVWEC